MDAAPTFQRVHGLALDKTLSLSELRSRRGTDATMRVIFATFITGPPPAFLLFGRWFTVDQMRPSISGVRLHLMSTVGQLHVGSDRDALAMPQCSAVDASWVRRSGWRYVRRADVSVTESSPGWRGRPVALEAAERAVIKSQARDREETSSIGSSTRRPDVSWIGNRRAPCGSLSSLMPEWIAGDLKANTHGAARRASAFWLQCGQRTRSTMGVDCW